MGRDPKARHPAIIGRCAASLPAIASKSSRSLSKIHDWAIARKANERVPNFGCSFGRSVGRPFHSLDIHKVRGPQESREIPNDL